MLLIDRKSFSVYATISQSCDNYYCTTKKKPRKGQDTMEIKDNPIIEYIMRSYNGFRSLRAVYLIDIT